MEYFTTFFYIIRIINHHEKKKRNLSKGFQTYMYFLYVLVFMYCAHAVVFFISLSGSVVIVLYPFHLTLAVLFPGFVILANRKHIMGRP